MNDLAKLKPKKELSLRQMVAIETNNREVMTDYIAKHMKKGTDYGGIHINKTCPNKWNPSECHIEKHFSKDSLFKAGAEKVASLLKLRPEIEMDRQAWEMAGSVTGLFFFKCRLYSRQNGELIAEGMGACGTEEKQGNPNNAIKIGKKRAFVDAVLSAGALSDFFTQDLEDMAIQEPQPSEPKYRIHPPAPVAEELDEIVSSLLATPDQQHKIKQQLVIKGYKLEQLLGKYEVNTLEDLTSEQADTILINMRKLPDVTQSETMITDEDIEDFERSL